MSEVLKEHVREHWEQESCGARYGEGIDDERAYYAEIERARYEQDYMIPDFARFHEGAGKRVLEVGLGTGTDFIRWCRSGAEAYGRDLTHASVEHVRRRLELEGLTADVATGDAERLEFPDGFFDIYYSWGVLHHTPDADRALAEAYRVLKPGGVLRIMLYHHRSVATLLVWLLYGPLRLRWVGPRFTTAHHVESPGTRAFTRAEAVRAVEKYFGRGTARIQTFLSSGDLLTHQRSGKYQGRLWDVLVRIYPRWFVRRVVGHRFGFMLTVEAVKQ
jgi:ubiquinone/menaquinone biosynthesis C-methylase UbiE